MATKKKKKSALDDVNSGIVFPTIFSKEMNDRLIAAKSDDIAPLAQPRRKETTSFYEDFAPVRTVGTLSKDDDIAPTRKWFNKGLLKDGYDAGDIAKTILGTATDLDQNVKAGMLGIGEKVIDAGATGIGALGGALGNERFKAKAKEFVAKDLYDEHKLAANPIIQSNPFASVSHILGLDADETSILGEKSDDLAYSGGQLLGTVALQGVGVPWFVTTGATSFGSEVETAFREGANYKEAALRGGISAGADILTEKLTGGIKFGGKTLDDALLRPLTQKISNKLARNLVNVGLDATGEGFEEVLASVANNLGEKLYNEDAKVKDLLLSEQAMDEYLESFIGGFVLGGGAGSSRAVQSIKTGRDYKTGLTDNEQKVVDAEVKKRITEEEKDGKKLSTKERTAIEEDVRNQLEKGYISIDSIESALGDETYSAYKALSDEMDEYTSLNKMKAMEMTGEQSDRLAELKEKNKQTSYESEKARLKEQLSQEVDGLTQSDAFLRESYNEKSRRGQAFEADLKQYKSKEQQAIIQKAIDSKILNNTRRTHEFVDMISKIAADKGVSFDFTSNEKLKESGFAVDGATVNGYVQGNNISLNIQSAKSLNKVVGHEITHVLEGTELYSELQKVVREYATTKGEYGSRLEALQALYKDVDGANIENELTADLIGDYLFTDEKFINNLSTKNPNIFKKIYEEIKYLVKVATAGSKEAKELEKVKRIFEKAYKENVVSKDTGKKYSINNKFYEQLDNWDGETIGFSFVVGETSDALQKAGVPKKQIRWDASKISTLLKKHTGMSIETVRKIPELLENPIIVIDSKKGSNSKIVMGDLYDNNGKVVTAVLLLTPTSKKGNVLDLVKISSAEGRSHIKSLFTKEDGTTVPIRYVDKKRIQSWLNVNRLQLPLHNLDLDSNNIIPESQENTTKFSISEDSDHKQLSDEQTAYFKDSVIRDSQGRLLVLYHQTGEDFTVFDTKHEGAGSYDHETPYGVFLKPTASNIGIRGEKQMPLYALIKNPMQVRNREELVHRVSEDAEYHKLYEEQKRIDVEYQIKFEDAKNGLRDYMINWRKKNPDAGRTALYDDAVFMELYEKEDTVVDEWTETSNRVREKAKLRLTEYLKEKGYDGLVIDEDVGSFGRTVQTIIAFEPNNVKSTSNQNPTENPDINLSLSKKGQQDIAPIGKYNVYGSDIALDTSEDIAPVRSDIKQKNSEVRRGYKPLTEEQANARDKERMAAEFPPGISKIARNQIARELKEILPFAVSGQVKRVEEMIQRYADSENPDGNALYMEIKEEFASNTLKRRIEEVADVQSALRTTRIAVSDAVKNGITDFNTLRKSVFGKMQLAKDGLQVDEAYQELSMMYPNYFPEDIVNPADQLLQMIDVANQERYANEEITADGKAIARATNHIMDKVEEYKKSKEERERRKRESRAYLHATIIDKIKTAFSAAGFDFDEVLKNAKNKSTFASVDNTPIRFIEKTFGYKAGQILNKLTMDQTALNESEGIKWLNSFTNRKNGFLAQIVKEYGIKPGSKESAAAQMYGEGFYVNDKNELIQYGDMELMRDFPDAKVRENIRKLATDPRIRQIYDDTLDKINESRTRNAYPEIPRRNNYFLHFRAMDDTFSRLGLPFNPNDIRAKDLPTDLNGVTADLKPGQPYFASANQRKGHKTTYDLLGGLEKYLTSAKNQIYHIDDIQTLRALRNYIATMFGQAHGLDNIDQMSEEEAEARIKEVFGSHLSVFSRFLTEEANLLAGKTDPLDRAIESKVGRKGIMFMDTVRKQVGQNMIGFNLSSSLTNLVSVVQGFSKANKADAIKAFAQVAANKINGMHGRSDGFADQNPLIIRRKGADRYTRTLWQKASDAGFVFMGAIDNISTEFIVRAKYNELTRKGMDSEKAHIESSKWAARILGDRSLGQMPQLYNSKLASIFIQFQLEVRNQLDSMFYDTIQETKMSAEEMDKGFKKNAVMAAKVTSTFAQLAVFQHLFGKAFESVAGYNPTFDIISTIITACGFDDEEDSEDMPMDNLEQAFFELLEDLPYASTLTGGRIPISSAFPVKELVTGTDNYGNEKSRLETVKEVAPYYFMPTGYNQIKKTMQGLKMFDDDLPISGSYTDSGNLRFSVEDTPLNKMQAAVFGQWASKNARQYFDEELAPLKEKQVQEYIDSGVSMQEYWDYRQGLSGLKTSEEKIDYISGLDLPIKAQNVFANNVLDRKDPVDLTGYDEFANFEEFDFAMKNPEKYEFFTKNGISYKDYAASEESKIAYSNLYESPAKCYIAKAIGGYGSYIEISDTLSTFEADKDKNGESIRGTKKKKVWDYIDSLDLTEAQKYILFKSKGYADDSHNYEIIDYLNERDDISAAEMRAILEELDFKVDAQGNISW